MNANKEIIRHAEARVLLCATISYKPFCRYNKPPKVFSLKIGGDVAEFLLSLDFKYDAGYGTQELFGTLWWKDGTWSERAECDGSEWWEHRSKPEIPEELQ